MTLRSMLKLSDYGMPGLHDYNIIFFNLTIL